MGAVRAPAPPGTETEATGQSGRAEWAASHAVNVRLSIPLPFGRFYLTVVAGRERRSSERLKRERRKHPLTTFGNMAFVFALGTVGGLAVLALLQLLSVIALQELGMAEFQP